MQWVTETPGPGQTAAQAQKQALCVLALATLLAMTTWFSGTAVSDDIAVAWNMNPERASWLAVAVQIGFVVGALLSAATGISDRVPPRTLFAWGAAIAAASNGALILAQSPEVGLLLRFISGAALALVYPMAMKLVATWFRSGRGFALGVMIAALTLGSATPHLLRALGGTDWVAVIVASTILTCFSGVLVRCGIADGPYPFPKTAFSARAAFNAMRDRGTVLVSIGYFGHMWELYAMWASLGLYFGYVFSGRNDHVASIATFVAIAAGAVGCLLAGRISDRFGRTISASFAMAISGACCLVIGLVADLPSWIPVMVAIVWGSAVIADSAQFSAAVTEITDQSLVGTILTIQMACGFALSAVTIHLVPIWAAKMTWQFAFAPLALGPMIGIFAMLLLRRLPEATRMGGGLR